MCLLESPFIPLPQEKAQCQRMSQDKAAFGHMPNEEASKNFSDNPLTLLLGDFAHYLGNTILSLSSHFLVYQVRTYFLKGNSHLMYACTKSLQSCLTLCDSMDYSPPGSSVRGILQATTLEWVAIPFSRGSSQTRNQTHISCLSCIAGRFFTTELPGKPIT